MQAVFFLSTLSTIIRRNGVQGNSYVTETQLSCYLVLLSTDSKTRRQKTCSFIQWPKHRLGKYQLLLTIIARLPRPKLNMTWAKNLKNIHIASSETKTFGFRHKTTKPFHSVAGPKQWEEALHTNVSSHWLSPYIHKSDVICRNTLSCLDQYTCKLLRLWNSRDCETV